METFETCETASTIDGLEKFQATLFTEKRLFEFNGHVPFDTVEINELGVDPRKPTTAQPGSEDKVRMLAARYAVGLPLWHESDCYDHGESLARSAEREEMNSGVQQAQVGDWNEDDYESDQPQNDAE